MAFYRKYKIVIKLIAIFCMYLLCVQSVFASFLTYESFLTKIPSKIEFIGTGKDALFGSSITHGDFNGDSIDDIVISSPYYSLDNREWCGKVSISFGSKEYKNNTSYKKDLLQSPLNMTFFGAHEGDLLGSSLTSGDFNNDGISDIAMGAYNALHKTIRPGKVYVMYGQKTWSRQFVNFALSKPDVEFVGYRHDDKFGLDVSSADINNDSVDDLIIGAPNASSRSINNNGAVHVFFGKDGGFEKNYYSLSLDDPDFSILGQTSNENFGAKISAGNFTNSGFTDLAISAYLANNGDIKEAGKIYIFKGRTTWFKTNASYSSTISGVKENGWFGFDMDTSDISGDTIDDLAISSFPYKNSLNGGSVSVFHGGSKFLKKGGKYFDSENQRAFYVSGVSDQSLIGSKIKFDDINNDGIKDLIIGAPAIGSPKSDNSGNVYVVYSSKENGFEKKYDVSDQMIGATIHGESADDWFGYSLDVLDFNNDRNKDIAVSSIYYDSKKFVNNGKTTVLLSSENPFGNQKYVIAREDNPVKKGEAVNMILSQLNLKEKKADEIASCLQFKDFCLFNFMAMSEYSDIKLEPEMILYPDVMPANKYYDDINTATLLGFVQGSLSEKSSPFKPDANITRMQALKMILTAADLVEYKYRFELENELGGTSALYSQKTYYKDVDPEISYQWWYPRYVNFAFENGLIAAGDFFRPDDKITTLEFNTILERTIKYLDDKENSDEKTDS
jgi:hypothetical protein